MKKSILFLALATSVMAHAQTIQITELGRFIDGEDGACEISTYDSTTTRLFITNADTDSIEMVDISDPTSPQFVGNIDILSYGGGINSVVSLNNGFIAAAIEANTKQDPGKIVFYDVMGNFVKDVTVGALPDMITVTNDGNKVIVANEGEPNDDYTVDPEGSISIIDISGGVSNVSQSNVTTIDFTGAPASIPGALNKPSTSWADDLEPEYIAVSEDSKTAAVVCQENNVLIFLNLENETITSYKGLGFKDHSLPENMLDASNRDSGINLKNWDVKGVYQPDAIAAYTVNGKTYYVSANEGDARDYDGYSSEVRIKDLTLDPTAFPNAASLQLDSNLGRLKTFTADMIGDNNNDGMIDELYSYGARSFSIWDDNGDQVYDSGDDFETYIKDNHPSFYNCDDGLADEMDSRSDDKGPEPEAVIVGKVGQRFYAFIGLERQGGIMVYNVTDPMNPSFETFIHTFDEASGEMTDIAPEGIIFIHKDESHTGKYMLIVSNEVSGTVTIYDINDPIASTSELGVEKQAIDMYPNPTNGVINVYFETKYNKNIHYQLLDVTGRVLRNGMITSNNQLDLSSFNQGLYLVNFYTENGNKLIESKRVIKH